MSEQRFDKIGGANGSKFDIQLGQAEVDEDRLAQRLQHCSLELKTERHQWEMTGNICIEFRHGGEPSGIQATEADFWVHELARGGETLAYIVIPRKRLLAICRDHVKRNTAAVRRNVGDGGKSDIVVLKLSNLLVELGDDKAKGPVAQE